MLSKFSLIYIIILLCSVVAGFVGAFSGIATLYRKKETFTHEEKKEIERKQYLASSALSLAIILQILLTPLWFAMLESFIPSLPGTMCLIGIHQNVPVVSWAATFFKLCVPALLLIWIIAHHIDKKVVRQPLLLFKMRLLIPVVIFMLVETALDFYFLFSLDKSTRVSCCTVFFESSDTTSFFLKNNMHSIFYAGAAVCFLVLLYTNLKNDPTKGTTLFGSVTSIMLVVLFVLALQTRLTPMRLPEYIVSVPFHQCIFCQVSTNIWSLLAFFAVWLGGILSFSANTLHAVLLRLRVDTVVLIYNIIFLKVSLAILSAGALLTIISFFKN